MYELAKNEGLTFNDFGAIMLLSLAVAIVITGVATAIANRERK